MQGVEAGLGPPAVEFIQGRRVVLEQLDQLTGRAAQAERGLLRVQGAGLEHVHRLRQQGGVVGVVGIAGDAALRRAPRAPERRSGIPLGDRVPDPYREEKPKPAERDAPILLRAPAFARVRLEPRGLVLDPHQGFHLVAVLAAGPRPAALALAALLQKRGLVDGGRVHQALLTGGATAAVMRISISMRWSALT